MPESSAHLTTEAEKTRHTRADDRQQEAIVNIVPIPHLQLACDEPFDAPLPAPTAPNHQRLIGLV